MGRYDIKEIEKHIEACLDFLRSIRCDVYTRAFWLMSLFTWVAAKKSDVHVVNASITQAYYSADVYAYRNAYAHNDNIEDLNGLLRGALNSIKEEHIIYAEIDSSVKALKSFIGQESE